MSTDNFDDNMPKIVLEQEDRDAYQRSRKQNTKASKKSESLPEEKVEKKTSGGSNALIYLLLLVSLGMGGWLYHMNQIQQQNLTNAQQRINELENRLSATGEEMGNSAVAMQVRVKELAAKTDELWNQMDKLWASAWRRNQQEIKELNNALEKQQASGTKQINQVQQSIDSNSGSLTNLEQQITTQVEQLAVLDMSLSQLALTGSEREIAVNALSEKLVVLEQRNNALLNRLAELEKWKSKQQAQNSVQVVPRPSPVTPPATAGSGQLSQ